MRSLRGRLTLGLTIVVAGVLLVAGLLAAHDVSRSERDALDDRLLRTAELSRATALAAVQEELPGGDDRLDAVLSATQSSLRLVLGNTTLLDAGDPPPKIRAVSGGLSTVESEGIRYRVYTTSLRDKSLGGLARLELTTRMTGLEEREDDYRRTLVLLGLAALLVTAALVFLASSLVLRPLERLRTATASIERDADLDRRVPDDRGPLELRALGTSFNAMLGRLGRSAADRQRALDATRRFAADAGHELRTPMTSIQAALSALARHPDLPPERRARMAADALDQQRRLVELLDGLQALARGDASPEAGAVDLAELADSALLAAAGRFPELQWTSDIPEGAVVMQGWEPGLRSMVDNLLENAARHGGHAVHLTITAEPAVIVEDDGAGVDEAERDRIFLPFARADATTATGSGLGLALVAQQAEHHGGAVTVDRSERLGGARFAVSLRG